MILARFTLASLLLVLAACAAPQAPAPGYRLGLHALEPEHFGNQIGASDDVGLGNDFPDSRR